MNKISSIHKNGTTAPISIEQVLLDALDDVRTEGTSLNRATKIIVVSAFDEEGEFHVGFKANDIRMSNFISIIEVLKSTVLRKMGY